MCTWHGALTELPVTTGSHKTPAVTVGSPTVIMPQPLVDAIQKHKGSLLLGTPALYRMIIENNRLSMYDLSSLKYKWSGGDVLLEAVFKRFKKLTDHPIYQVYGSTETGGLALADRGNPQREAWAGHFLSRDVLVVEEDTFWKTQRADK